MTCAPIALRKQRIRQITPALIDHSIALAIFTMELNFIRRVVVLAEGYANSLA